MFLEACVGNHCVRGNGDTAFRLVYASFFSPYEVGENMQCKSVTKCVSWVKGAGQEAGRGQQRGSVCLRLAGRSITSSHGSEYAA